MRTLLSLCAAGVLSLTLLGLAPSQADAAWWNRGTPIHSGPILRSNRRSQADAAWWNRGTCYYYPAYSAYYSPAYSAYYAPTYSYYYTPSYVSAYYAPLAYTSAYYRPAYSSYYPGYSSYYYAPAASGYYLGNAYAYPVTPGVSFFYPY
jgi:hypothetical protein